MEPPDSLQYLRKNIRHKIKNHDVSNFKHLGQLMFQHTFISGLIKAVNTQWAVGLNLLHHYRPCSNRSHHGQRFMSYLNRWPLAVKCWMLFCNKEKKACVMNLLCKCCWLKYTKRRSTTVNVHLTMLTVVDPRPTAGQEHHMISVMAVFCG